MSTRLTGILILICVSGMLMAQPGEERELVKYAPGFQFDNNGNYNGALLARRDNDRLAGFYTGDGSGAGVESKPLSAPSDGSTASGSAVTAILAARPSPARSKALAAERKLPDP